MEETLGQVHPSQLLRMQFEKDIGMVSSDGSASDLEEYLSEKPKTFRGSDGLFVCVLMDKQQTYIQEMEESFATIQIEEEEQGGLCYANTTDELNRDNPVKNALVQQTSVNSGYDSQRNMTARGEIGGGISGISEKINQNIPHQIFIQNSSLSLEGNSSGPDTVELSVVESKRRRMDLDHNTVMSTTQAQDTNPPVIMNALAWNCQGLGSPGKIQFLQEVTRSEKPSFVFLCEIISSYGKMEKLCHKLGFEGFIVVEPQGKSGGIALFWKNADVVNLLSFSRSHIDVSVNMSGSNGWRLIGIYGEPARPPVYLGKRSKHKLLDGNQIG
ncbi:hypothetical protein POM88_021709 [Heracleum sosnowskyi]|uniref:Uncharacterized protein n=1 Tax=Heracleum sosnowskyi TaxID=360622 RepID=A0AAD8MT35_9APIA|nr:hypothetical protein POM88_021709 [Heracleum sosnowskyi]